MKYLIGAGILLVGLVSGLLLRGEAVGPLTIGSAPVGLAASNVQVTYVEVGPGPVLLLTKNDRCTSRIITSGSTTLRLLTASSSAGGFATSSTNLVGGNRGLIQAASTSVVYDGGTFGCEFLAAVTANPTTTITVIENF